MARQTSPPTEALAAVHSVGVEPQALHHRPKPGPPRPIVTYTGADLVLTYCSEEAGRRLLQLEIAGRAWAQDLGLRTANVLASDSDGGWMVARLITPTPAVGRDYVRAAIAAADTIMSAPMPSFDVAATQWTGNSEDRIQRFARLLVGRFPITKWRAAKSAALQLSDQRTAHGDFYPRNALPTPAAVGNALRG